MSDTAVRTAWGIPQNQYSELGVVFAAAQAKLQLAQSSERTPVITEQCREAFEAMVSKMRFFHSHYFLVPPLDNAALVSLGLVPKDGTVTRTGKPTAQVRADLDLAGGRHQLSMEIVYLTGSPEDKANKGYRAWYKVVPQGGPAPTHPEELTKSFYTQRKKDIAHFDYGDSGKMVYMAIQVENDGIKGDWGPIVSALIP
jgi:hypothetical protein